ncbi:MAG TPA: S8 family serine peptidase [Pyrinomonadaceae bacterium]|nr:S8 family serine peptidase [Pyrinomonadaceae bacterium]
MKKTALIIGFLSCAIMLLALTFPIDKASAEKRSGIHVTPMRPAEEPFVAGRVLVKFQSNIGLDHARQIIAALGARDAEELPATGVFVLDLPQQVSEAGFAKAMQMRPEVEFAELDHVLRPADVVPNDPWFANWEGHLRKIQAPAAWSTTVGSSNVVIAILDTGVDANHEDLASKIVPGWNSYNNNSTTTDVSGHGTAVAGTAGAASNNGVGVASVCWSCRIMPIRVSDTTGYATYSSIASGLTWAADHGARVANISYMVSDSSAVSSAAQYFQGKGGVVTSSAGNYSSFSNSVDNPYILTVSATDQFDVIYSYSNTGKNIDVAAPGDSFSTQMGGGYVSTGGTSYSAPIVAGVAALVLSVNPQLSGDQVQNILKQSADDLGAAGWDPIYGSGRVNAARAVSMAGGGGPIADTIPPAVGFVYPTNGMSVFGVVPIQISATDNTGVSAVNLILDGTSIGTTTISPYAFQWDSTSVANGPHTFSVQATDIAGNTSAVSITVSVNNVSPDTTPPSVAISSPTNGSKVSVNLPVYVNASDNVKVVRVELYADGVLVSGSNSAPFTTKWTTKKVAAGAHNLQCKAYDAVGNTATSEVVTVYK